MFQDMLDCAKPAAELLKQQKRALLVSHIDADGISAAGIASTVLDRLNIAHETMFVKSMDPTNADEIRKRNMFTWLTDLGSGSISMLEGVKGIIADHHIPEPTSPPPSMRGNILAYNSEPAASNLLQVNPHLCGHDGTSEISGAGAAFVLALAVDEHNRDLASLAIVGALGDMQDQSQRSLIGLNRDILDIGVSAGVVEPEEDLRFFGRESRGLPKFLMYAGDPALPGLENERDAIAFLSKMGIRLQDHRGWWRVWTDLEDDEKNVVIRSLREYLIDADRMADAENLTGEVYSLPREKKGSGFYDGKEFSTMLNSCGRYDRADIGLLLAKGDRGGALREARNLRKGHRRNLVTSIQVIREMGVEELPHLYWVDVGDKIRDTVVGTVAGMYLSSIKGSKPILALATADEGKVKASIRGNQKMVDAGLDLSAVMKHACSIVGGEGGGHRIAAGATIPKAGVKDFIDAVEEVLASQVD